MCLRSRPQIIASGEYNIIIIELKLLSTTLDTSCSMTRLGHKELWDESAHPLCVSCYRVDRAYCQSVLRGVCQTRAAVTICCVYTSAAANWR